MTDIPDEKSKRLAALNQDVFAVQPDGSRAAPRQSAKAPAARADTGSTAPTRSAQPKRSAPVTLSVSPSSDDPAGAVNRMALAMMVVAFVVVVTTCAGVVVAFMMSDRLDLLDSENRAQASVIESMERRIALLEGQLTAAEEDTNKMGTDQQANVLQLTTRVRKLARELDAVTGKTSALENAVSSATAMSERAASVAGEQSGRINSLAREVAAIALNAPSGAAPAPAAGVSGDSAEMMVRQTMMEQEIAELQSRLQRLERSGQ